MSAISPDSSRDEIEQLLGDIAELAGGIEPDDLRELAKLHGMCDRVSSILSGPDSGDCAALSAKISSLGALLEVLVLGEAQSPNAVLAEARQIATSLADFSDLDGVLAPEAASGDQPVQAQNASSDGETDDARLVSESAVDSSDSSSTESPIESSSAVDSTESGSPPCADTDDSANEEAAPAVEAYVSEPLLIQDAELDFITGFVEEAGEHIDGIEGAVLEVERNPEDADKVNDLFRPFHTIKGMAGFLNLRDINRVTHEVETLLDQARKDERKITPGLIDLVFQVVDILKAQIGAVATYMQNPNGEPVPQPEVAEMMRYLREVVAGKVIPQTSQPGSGSGAMRVGENLVEQGAAPQEVIDFALTKQTDGTDKKVGELLLEDKAVTAKQISQAIRPQAQAAAAQAPPAETSVRIDTEKLDALVDMVGELVIAQTLVSAHPSIVGDPRLTKDVGQVGKIIRDVQEVAMGMRMIPIGATFQRMARLVRDVSRKAGKDVDLVIAGEETELDKNVIQQIGDPLVHMVRNACDHGVETPEQRRAAGKPPKGQVHLSAYHQGGNIVIEIRDNGKGLDAQKILAKAIERGVVRADEDLSESEIYALIFAPGFSMAEQITDISGRGVGMDVVKRNIEALRGRVEIQSKKGEGTRFLIRLPLTLAIIDGMVVRLGKDRFIIQTITIEQSLRPKPEQITTVQRRGEVLNIRGELVPLVQLGQIFGLCGRVDPCEAMVIVAQIEERKVGLVVQELIGQQQVVIKSLGDRFEGLKGISGAAILGDGRVGLILEMSGIEAAHELFRSPDIQRRGSKSGLPSADQLNDIVSEISEADAPIVKEHSPELAEPVLV